VGFPNFRSSILGYCWGLPIRLSISRTMLSRSWNVSWPVGKGCTCLSKGGKVILIKSTLANLPMYYMSLFAFLTSVAKCIEKIRHDIFCGWLGEEFKYHLVSWSKFCFSISKGGLGIRNLLVFNCALLGKWLWRYGCGREAWLRVVVDSKSRSL
jgi:hypothetical protein